MAAFKAPMGVKNKRIALLIDLFLNDYGVGTGLKMTMIFLEIKSIKFQYR